MVALGGCGAGSGPLWSLEFFFVAVLPGNVLPLLYQGHVPLLCVFEFELFSFFLSFFLFLAWLCVLFVLISSLQFCKMLYLHLKYRLFITYRHCGSSTGQQKKKEKKRKKKKRLRALFFF